MATRRSRIKAVANLPARRSRPLPNSNVKEESPDSSEDSVNDRIVSPESPPKKIVFVKNDSSSRSQSDCSEIESQVISNDRKSVIVSVEKDRKSVIVNRSLDQSIATLGVLGELGSCNTGKEGINVEEANSCTSDGKETVIKDVDSQQSCAQLVKEPDHPPKDVEKVINTLYEEPCLSKEDQAVVKLLKASEGGTSSNNQPKQTEPCSLGAAAKDEPVQNNSQLSEGSSDACVSSNTRGPLRGRRSKPVVNLSAASRKRQAPETSNSSVCSPPVQKLRAHRLHNSESESDHDSNVHETILCGERPEVNNVQDTSATGSTTLPVVTSLPPASISHCLDVTVPSQSGSNVKSKDPNGSEPSSSSGNTSLTSEKELNSVTKRKPSTSALKAAAARKNFKSRFGASDPPPRSALTMFDLIFYNPSKNPMKSSGLLSTVKSRSRQTSVSSVSSIHEERLSEEAVDDVGVAKNIDGNDDEEHDEPAMPVPRVKVGPDGSLILDEQSLVIETTGSKKIREELERSEVVIDTGSSYGLFKRTKRTKDWSDNETKKFYRALNVVGTDFSLMKPLFRDRTRRELKLKYKKEERLNPSLVSKALNEHLDFDVTELEKECALEEEEEKRQETSVKEKDSSSQESGSSTPKPPRPKKQTSKRVKKSRLSIEIESDSQEEIDIGKGEHIIAETSAEPKLPKKPPKKKRKITAADEDYEILSKGIGIMQPVEERTVTTRAQNKQLEAIEIQGSSVSALKKQSNPTKQTSKPTKKIISKTDSEKYRSTLGDTDGIHVAHGVESGEKLKKHQVISDGPRQVAGPNVSFPVSSLSNVQPLTVKSPTAKGISTFILKVPTPPVCSPSLAKPMVVGETVMSTEPKQAASPSLSPLGSPKPKIVATSTRKKTAMSPVMKKMASPVPSTSVCSIRSPKPTILVTPARKTMTNSQLKQIDSPTPSPSPAKSIVLGTPTQKALYRVVQNVNAASSTPLRVTHTPPQTPSQNISVGTPISRLLPSVNLPRMEPGSLIVLKTPIPENPDKHILQVYMVTNSPPSGTTAPRVSHTPIVPGISALPAPSATLAKPPSVSSDSDSEKVLTKL